MKRRVLSLLLALVLLVSAFPVTARAEETKEEKKLTSIEIPVASGGDVELPNDDDYYTSASSAGSAIRSALKNRQATITIKYRVPNSSWTESGVNTIVDNIIAQACKHTGNGNEGDYLYAHIITYTWSAKGTNYGGSYWYADITVPMTYSSTYSQESSMSSKVSSLLSSLNPTGTNYQKLKKVYDWMCNNISYDTSGSNVSYSAYGALVNRSANQWGFASLMYRLCMEMDIKCRVIYNSAKNQAWNIATTGNLFYNMYAAKDVANYSRSYFLVNNSSLGVSRASQFTTSSFNSSYPMGSYNYNPNTAATIVTQPKSVSVANGKTAKVTVQASGSGLTYKWYYKEPGGSKFYLTNSFTGNSYSVPMSEARNGRKVYCKVTDQYGNTVQTNTVTLSMAKTALKITSQPKSVTVAKGATAKVTVKAVGDGLSYRWFYKDAGASDYTYTSTFKGNSYSVEMTAARNGRRVLCKVYDKYGNMVQSSSALLKMQQTVKITSQPKSVTVSKGATAKVTVKATGDGLTYRWYYKDAGASDYTYTSSFTGNTYSITMNEARNGRRVLCRVYDKYGNSVKSDSAQLNMKQTVKITSQPKSVTVAEGATAKVTVKATGDGLTYRWYYKDAGASDYTYTSSFTGNTYSVKMTDARNGRRVLCRVYDKYGNSVQSDSALLKMK